MVSTSFMTSITNITTTPRKTEGDKKTVDEAPLWYLTGKDTIVGKLENFEIGINKIIGKFDNFENENFENAKFRERTNQVTYESKATSTNNQEINGSFELLMTEVLTEQVNKRFQNDEDNFETVHTLVFNY